MRSKAEKFRTENKSTNKAATMSLSVLLCLPLHNLLINQSLGNGTSPNKAYKVNIVDPQGKRYTAAL